RGPSALSPGGRACFDDAPASRKGLGDMARIMVVDDEPAVAQIIGNMLESGGHDVLFPSDSRHPTADVVAQEYDLLITDVVMPEISGWEVMRMAKMAHPDMPVVAISGGGGAFTPQTALQMSALL